MPEKLKDTLLIEKEMQLIQGRMHLKEKKLKRASDKKRDESYARKEAPERKKLKRTSDKKRDATDARKAQRHIEENK